MKRILIIGSCGSGKSTLAKVLSEKLNLPLIGLDQYYWKSGWIRSAEDEWRKKVFELIKEDKWIMEGNYQSTFDIRFPASDTIIILNINRITCFWRTWKRRILKNRIDKLNGCDEKIDFELMRWILWGYPTRGRKQINSFLKQYPDKNIIFIKNSKDLKRLMNSFK